MAKDKMTGPEQTAMLKRLNQQAAAFLVGVTARTLRDRTDAPRNEDGTYNGPELIAWWRNQLPRPSLSDDDLERLLVVRDVVSEKFLGLDDAILYSILDAMDDLRAKYGENTLIVLVELLLAEWRDLAHDTSRAEAFYIPTEAEIREQILERFDGKVAERMTKRQADVARKRLHIAIVCGGCGKLRRGRQWTKAEPPEGYAVGIEYEILCPACEDKDPA